MQAIVNWIRSLLILYFLMMILLYFTAGSSYQKLIRFFMGLVLLLTIAAPVIRLFDGEESLLDRIQIETFEQYQQELSENRLYSKEDDEEERLRSWLMKEYGLEGQVVE
jgi:hypothetical protein